MVVLYQFFKTFEAGYGHFVIDLIFDLRPNFHTNTKR